MEIKFNGVDRLYKEFWYRLTRKAMETWKTGRVVQGEYLQKFETKIAKQAFRKFGVGVGSATDGLYFAMKSLGLNHNSTIACPVISYSATRDAITRLGATIKYIDVDSIGNIGSLDGAEVDAVVYVNLYGNPADYDRLNKFCDDRGIPLIEDAAQSQGAWYHGRPSGKLGKISVYSFDPTKNLPCFGTGGMILTDSFQTYKKLLDLRKGPTGHNSWISEDHANQMTFLLGKFDKLQNMRSKIYQRYQKQLTNIQFLKTTKKGLFSSMHKCVILSNERNKLKTFLEKSGIQTQIHYTYLLDNSPTNHYPMAELIQAQCLSLPIYPYLKNDEIDYICNKINYFYGV